MWRSVLIAGIFYGFGHPGFDDVRPGFLDRPLQALYQHVNKAALESHQTLATIEDTRFMRHLSGYVSYMQTQLRREHNATALAQPSADRAE